MKDDDCSSSVTAVESSQTGLQNLRNAEGGVQFSRRRSGSSSSGQCQCKLLAFFQLRSYYRHWNEVPIKQ